MKLFTLIIPLLFLLIFLYAAFKKVKVYDAVTEGIREAIPLLVNIFPYIATVFMLTELMEHSGFSAKLCERLNPILDIFGIPKEIIKLILIKPFSGSGSTALLTELLETYGADSYICRCGAICYGSSETVFYIGAVYFAKTKNKNFNAAIIISLLSSLIAAVVGCFLCRIM